MKHFLSLLLVLLSFQAFGKKDIRTDNLYYTCKVWGFLKYHHPNISARDMDWDKELKDMLLKMDKVGSAAKRNRLLKSWTDNLVTLDTLSSQPLQNKYIEILPDNDWIQDSESLGKELSLALMELTDKGNHKNKYCSFNVAGIPVFNEDPSWKPGNKQDYMLALFRYWNAIEYFFPYKNIISKDWDEILREEIPVFDKICDDDSYLENMIRLATRIEDGHSEITGFGKSGISVNSFYYKHHIFGMKGIPVELGMVEGKTTVIGFCNKDGYEQIKLGDRIISFNNSPIDSIINARKNIIAKSNNCNDRIFGIDLYLHTDDDSVAVEYLRDGIVQKEMLPAVEFKWDSPNHNASSIYMRKDTSFYVKPVSEDIYYIDPSNIKNPDKVYDDYTRIRNSKALIIDLRRYPKDLGLVYLICEGNPYKGIKFLAPLQGTPGSFHSEPTPVQTMDFTNPEHYKGKIILLVNNLTQSSGETAAMLLQTYGNTTVIGTQTAGANGNVTYLPLPGYIRARFSSIGIAYPTGELLQKRGVKIGQTIKPTLEGIRQGKDELLEYAVMMAKEMPYL